MAETAKKPKTALVRLSNNDYIKLEKLCEEKRRTKSDMIRIIIQDYLKIINA